MARRAPETLADYVVVGIAPALIMLLVGSLVSFLIGVFYQGEFPYRLTWVMGLFVLATVCVARISMEEGAGYAALFGLPLGVVVGIAVVYFVEIRGPLAPISALINWSLLGLIWWCAHQLTWDCTLLDDRRDTTGQGLLQSMGWDRSENGSPQQETIAPASTAAASSNAPSVASTDAAKPEKPLWWQRWFGPREQPAAHGRWVVYFSVAALPLFGLGQFFIPSEDVAGRRYAFWMLVIYVGSGLGLLLTTSFLGLRRYIRQRQLEMPVEMAATWLSVGVVMILGLLAAAALLPRPAPEYSMAAAIESRLGSFASPDRSASRVGFGPEGTKPSPESQSQSTRSGESAPSATGEGQGKPNRTGSAATDSGQNQQQTSESSTSSGIQNQTPSSSGDGSEASAGSTNSSNQGSSSTEQSPNQSQGSDTSSGSSAFQQGGSTSNEASGAKGEPPNPSDNSDSNSASSSQANTQAAENTGGKSGETNSSNGSTESAETSRTSEASSGSTAQPPAPRPSVLDQALSGLGKLLRLLFYAAVAVLAAFLAWKYRQELAAAWRQLLKELGELWSRLFGKPTALGPVEPMMQRQPIPKSFSDFGDPFVTGAAQRMSPAQLVQYSFDALQAWGRDFATPRENGQTPHEFSESLAAQQPAIDTPARQLAEIYSRMAYARQAPPTQTLAILKSLWQTMSAISRQPLSAGNSDKPVGSV